MINRYELILFPILHDTLNIKEMKKPHLWEVEVWRYHKKIDEKKSKNKKEIQKWIKDQGYNEMYDDNECMIYIKINGIQITYWAFMENKYYLH